MFPSVSSIIATRNRTGPLVLAVESIASQSLHEVETIVTDDGSNTEVLNHHVKLMERLGPSFRLIRPSSPGCRGSGPSGARNRGASYASGKFLAFLDDDDLWVDPDYLATAVEQLEKSNADIFFGHIDGVREGVSVLPPWAVRPEEAGARSKTGDGETLVLSDASIKVIARSRIIHPGQMVVRKALFDSCGGFFEGLWSNSEDRNLMLRLMDKARKVLFYNRVVLRYRLPAGDSISRTESEMYHILQRILSSHHARLVCDKSIIRSAARASEAWSLREASRWQAEQGLRRESISFALQAMVTYPNLGSMAFAAKAIAGLTSGR